MKKKLEIEQRIKKLEENLARVEKDIKSVYATNKDIENWTKYSIPNLKIRIDELKWVLGTI